jgi:diguanylate cyclase (GGDEF)-like protein
MHVTLALNSILGSLLIICLIFADYKRKYNTDSFQRMLFLVLLTLAGTAMLCDFCYFLLHGYAKPWVYYFLYFSLTTYFITQSAAYFFVFIFVDYTIFKNTVRTKKIMFGVLIAIIIHFLILLFNLHFGFYFSISRNDNLYHFGAWYIIRMIISYAPIVLGALDIMIALSFPSKRSRRSSLVLIFLFSSSLAISSSIDLLFQTNSLIWPCFAASLLCTYFFIIGLDTRIDLLTGIGNRLAFNEFIDKISRQTAKESWSVIMLDMDHFKEINDTFGHTEGDMALRDIAKIISDSTQNTDFISRYGGDEFVIATKSDPEALMKQVQTALNVLNASKTRLYTIQMSFGWGVFQTGTNRIVQDFLEYVDSLMYSQKKYKGERRSGSSYKRESDNA